MTFKIKKKLHQLLNSKSIDIFYTFLLLLLLYLTDTIILEKDFKLGDYFEFKLATSISLTYFIAVLFKWIGKRIEQSIEDGLKLTVDYSSIVKMYEGNVPEMVCKLKDSNMVVSGELANLRNNDYEFYPIICIYQHNPRNSLEITDRKDKNFQLPLAVESQMLNILGAHKHSQIFNALNIRLDNFTYTDNRLILHTSRTTYFNGMVTNRAMDHNLGSKVTIRSLYEFSNKISELKNSQMSNHIGFNGFVITGDQRLLFVKRLNNVSIGKNILGCSFGASLKTKYCLDSSGEFTSDGLEKAIKAEIFNEIGLDESKYHFTLNENLIAIYRDLVEGGKPQLLYAVSTPLTADEVKAIFNEKIKRSKQDVKNLIVDGKSLIDFHIESTRVDRDSIWSIENNRKFKTIPSVSASTLLTLQWLKK